jgi:hypothetical protein
LFSVFQTNTHRPLKTLLLLLLLIFPWAGLIAQEHGGESEAHKHRHMVSVLLAHAHLSQGVQNGDTKWLALPSWMLSYNYLVNEKWAIGLHSDIIIEEFEVEANVRSGGDGETLERSYPISMVAAGTYKPLPWLGLIGGGGFEYAREDTFGMVRLGLEPNLRLSEKIELVFNLSYDIKIDAYDTWNLGFGIARTF